MSTIRQIYDIVLIINNCSRIREDECQKQIKILSLILGILSLTNENPSLNYDLTKTLNNLKYWQSQNKIHSKRGLLPKKLNVVKTKLVEQIYDVLTQIESNIDKETPKSSNNKKRKLH